MRIDPAVLRDLKLAPPDVREGEEDVPDTIDRIFRRADTGILDLIVRAGESAEEGGRITTDFVASTASVDRMGDVVDQGTWRLAAWRKNPVILYEHAPPVVGRGSAKINRGEGRLEIGVTWDVGDHNPIGTLAGMQHLNGFRSAGSVGFIPGKAISRADLPDDDPRRTGKDVPRWRAGHVFSHNELLEFSSVAVPANAEAVHLSAHARDAEDPSEQIRRFVEESTAASVASAILDAVKADEQIRRAILALVWGDSPSTPPRKSDPLDHLWRQ